MQLSARSSLNVPQPTAGDEGLRTIKIVPEESSSRAQVELCRCSSVLFDADHSEQTTIHAVVTLCASGVVAATPWL